MRAHHPPPRRHRRGVGALIAATLPLTFAAGCLTGPRPTLMAEGAEPSTGDASADRMVAALEAPPADDFTAQYRITNNFGAITREATVVHDGTGRRSVTVGDVRFVIDGPSVSTCRASGADGTPLECSGFLDDATISDLQVTHEFYGRSAANRLTADALRRVGPIESYQADLPAGPADCLSVPLVGGSKVYCTSADGILASYQGPDVLIELLEIGDGFAEAAFVPHP